MRRWYVVTAIACLLSLSSQAQSLAFTRIHFLNLMVGNNAEIKTTANESKPIVIKSRTWVVIQYAKDSTGFMVNNKAYFVHFEPGKQYYFVIQSTYSSRPAITEKSEKEFILTVSMNSAKGPEKYMLDQ